MYRPLFYANGTELEEVQDFFYLGISLTPQLAYTKHVEKLNVRGRSKIGHIFSQTHVINLSLDLALRLFDVYIKPIYDYGSPIWTTKVSKNAKMNIDRVFLKYLKRYLGVPASASNAITYFLTNTKPLSQRLFENPTKPLQSINLSFPLTGHQLTLIKNRKAEEFGTLHNELPEEFYGSKPVMDFKVIPYTFHHRRNLTSNIFDLKHRKICSVVDYHIYPNPQTCKCKICDQLMGWHHPCLPSH